MIDLHRFLINPFDWEKISIAELFRFGTDHLKKLTLENPNGLFTARITATGAALSTFDKAFSQGEEELALRSARKLSKDNFRKALPQSIEKIYGAVLVKYGAKSPEMRECFRQGREVFHRATDDELKGVLDALVGALANHAADLADALTLANTLVTGWLVVYNASETATASTGLAERDRREARLALQLEFFLNLLAIAQAFPRQPEKLDAYMQQSLLMNPMHQEEPPTVTGTSTTPTPVPA